MAAVDVESDCLEGVVLVLVLTQIAQSGFCNRLTFKSQLRHFGALPANFDIQRQSLAKIESQMSISAICPQFPNAVVINAAGRPKHGKECK